MNASRRVFVLLRVELFGKLLLNLFVPAFRMLNQRSILFLTPRVTCLHFRFKLVSASKYRGPLSTRIGGLSVQVSKTFRRIRPPLSLRLPQPTRRTVHH